jgi:hypothetical protein
VRYILAEVFFSNIPKTTNYKPLDRASFFDHGITNNL